METENESRSLARTEEHADAVARTCTPLSVDPSVPGADWQHVLRDRQRLISVGCYRAHRDLVFIIGSCGMFIGALGSAIVKYDESKQKNANARGSG
jgi:hypothetical protein